jgi:DNA-binding NarL/FixJ family response regulator
MAKRVYLATTDLLFRSKLGVAVATAGAEVTRDEGVCDLGVVELGGPEATERIRALVARGVPVLAFGSHGDADALREARAAGADAVPNSQVEERLRAILEGRA